MNSQRKEAETQSAQSLPTLSRVDWRTIRHGICPNCGLADSFHMGPRGGESRNVLCAGCQMELNVGPVSGEIIYVQCPAERLKEIYGVEPRPSATQNHE